MVSRGIAGEWRLPLQAGHQLDDLAQLQWHARFVLVGHETLW
jgi:hypothetical protein